MKQIFFQSSLPRSGSTLLQNILGQNPDFYVTPTSGVLELLYAARGNYTNSPEFKAQDNKSMKNAFVSFCKQGLFGFYTSITDKSYVVDKSRGWGVHYNFLNSFYPNPKIICMVRNLADIFCSMEKKFRENQHLDSGIVKHSEFKGTTTAKRIDIWADTIPVGLAVERLQEMILQGIDKQVLFVKYEDLVSNPEQELTKIYNFLGVSRFKHDFNNIQQITTEDDAVYGMYGDHKIRTSLKVQPSQAEKILGKNICQNIKIKYAWYYQYFGYPV